MVFKYKYAKYFILLFLLIVLYIIINFVYKYNNGIVEHVVGNNETSSEFKPYINDNDIYKQTFIGLSLKYNKLLTIEDNSIKTIMLQINDKDISDNIRGRYRLNEEKNTFKEADVDSDYYIKEDSKYSILRIIDPINDFYTVADSSTGYDFIQLNKGKYKITDNNNKYIMGTLNNDDEDNYKEKYNYYKDWFNNKDITINFKYDKIIYKFIKYKVSEQQYNIELINDKEEIIVQFVINITTKIDITYIISPYTERYILYQFILNILEKSITNTNINLIFENIIKNLDGDYTVYNTTVDTTVDTIDEVSINKIDITYDSNKNITINYDIHVNPCPSQYPYMITENNNSNNYYCYKEIDNSSDKCLYNGEEPPPINYKWGKDSNTELCISINYIQLLSDILTKETEYLYIYNDDLYVLNINKNTSQILLRLTKNKTIELFKNDTNNTLFLDINNVKDIDISTLTNIITSDSNIKNSLNYLYQITQDIKNNNNNLYNILEYLLNNILKLDIKYTGNIENGNSTNYIRGKCNHKITDSKYIKTLETSNEELSLNYEECMKYAQSCNKKSFDYNINNYTCTFYNECNPDNDNIIIDNETIQQFIDKNVYINSIGERISKLPNPPQPLKKNYEYKGVKYIEDETDKDLQCRSNLNRKIDKLTLLLNGKSSVNDCQSKYKKYNNIYSECNYYNNNIKQNIKDYDYENKTVKMDLQKCYNNNTNIDKDIDKCKSKLNTSDYLLTLQNAKDNLNKCKLSYSYFN